MSTDLKAMKDHPSKVLETRATDFVDGDGANAFSAAANVLRRHESVNKVTFAALDNGTLDRVYEAYRGICERGTIEADAAFHSAVEDLLGLEC